MTAAQIREAARILDVQHAPDEEIVALVELGSDGSMLRIGPIVFHERSKPASLCPKRFLIDRRGCSIEEPLER